MKVIIDVGAANFSQPKPNNIYYLFEPEKIAYDKLVEKFKFNKNVFLFNTGLFNKNSTENLYVAKKKQCSSLLPPNWDVLKKYNAKRFLTSYTSQIKVDRLDNLLPPDIKLISILKLDTQGTEYEILEGCGDILKKIKTIICEVEHIELYKGQKLFNDVTNYLKDYGFELTGWKRQIKWKGDKIFGDAVYTNKNLK